MQVPTVHDCHLGPYCTPSAKPVRQWCIGWGRAGYLSCSWNKIAKVELDTPLNKLKPLHHVPYACDGGKCKIGPLKLITQH